MITKRNTTILLAVLLLAGLGGLLLLFTPFEATAPTPESEDVPLGSTGEVTIPDTWEMFTARALDLSFTFYHPPLTQVQAVSDQIYEIKYIGPASPPSTTITDGYYIALQFVPDQALRVYGANVEASNAPEETRLLGRPALRFETTSQLGNQVQKHIALEPVPGVPAVLDISYYTAADTDGTYEAQVMQILSTLEFSSTMTDPADPRIEVSLPAAGATVDSPITLAGEARGSWFFEATAPVVVVDWDGRIIGESYITAKGEWMTEEFVPFTGEVSYELPPGTPYQRGTVIFQKANPSGLPEQAAAVEVPVNFE